MSDLIERQDAIDAVHKSYDVILDFKTDGKTISSSIEDILSNLTSAQSEQHWIPCSERLPENGYWLWSAKGGEVQKDFYWDGHWENAEKYGYEVMAWLPIPKPYKGGEHE